MQKKNKEWAGRRRRGHKQLLADLKKMRGYWKQKEEAQIALYGELALKATRTCLKTDRKTNDPHRLLCIKPIIILCQSKTLPYF